MLGFAAVQGLSPGAVSRGYCSAAVSGFSSHWPLLLRNTDSGTHTLHQPWLTDSRARARCLLCTGSVVLQHVEYFWPGIKPMSHALATGFLHWQLDHQGSPIVLFFFPNNSLLSSCISPFLSLLFFFLSFIMENFKHIQQKIRLYTCIPVADSCWYMAKPIQYCKVKK